ncbi:MAG: hypothetical protein JWN78_1354 [Bacteroidota bacterium]|nr:hypothetical protein [Bacteroidota bacterium]
MLFYLHCKHSYLCAFLLQCLLVSWSEEKIMNDFYKRVYALVRKIPKGRVASYGDIAEHLGTKGSARTVGYAMNNAHAVSPPIPAHRVVNRNGLLTGKHHFGSPTMMQQLLENEGVKIIDDQVQDFEKLRWIPRKRN